MIAPDLSPCKAVVSRLQEYDYIINVMFFEWGKYIFFSAPCDVNSLAVIEGTLGGFW